jgi:tetratricopeptide (TPR) repeat protein
MLDDLGGALDDFNRAENLKPNDPLVLAGRGATKRIFGDFEGALEDLNRADDLDPHNSYIRAERGYTKRLLCDYPGALKDLNMADELEPNDALTLASRGATKRMLKEPDLEGALADLNRADELKPNDPFTVVNRALVYFSMHRTQDAFADFSLYDELVPNNTDYIGHKTQIEEELFRGIPSHRLKVTKLLGKGAFGEVRLAHWKRKLVAMKKPLGFDCTTVLTEAVTIM